MGTRIEKIEMTCFRGATNNTSIHLDPLKPITLIFGENGSGKSTIVDVLDFVLNEEYGSLNERSSTTPKTRYLPSVGSTASRVEASVTASGRTWIGRLDSKGPKTSGPKPRLKASILRRGRLFQFITETAGERYKALREFISLPVIQKSETSLRSAHKSKNSEYNEAVRGKQQADEALESLWNDEGHPGHRAWEWAKSQAAKDASELSTSFATLDALLRDLDTASVVHGRLQSSQEQMATDASALQRAEQELHRAEGKTDGESAPLVSLLEGVQRYLENREAPEVCPVCESSERAAALRENVARRLAQMKRIAGSKKKADEASTAVQKSQAILSDAEKGFSAAVRDLWLSGGDTLSKAIKIDLKRFQLLREKGAVLTGEVAASEAESLWIEVENVRERMTTKREQLQKSLNQLTAIRNYVSIVETKTKSATDLRSQVNRLEVLLEIVEGKRKQYIDEVLSSVASLVEGMYSRVHQGEGIGNVRLYLKPNVQGSLEFEAQFQHGSAVPPQAYYSDSHLDTLGVCLFLALSRHLNDDDGVIVLEDVLTSADSNHLERLIDMLHGESEHFNQLIITTHYRPWLERYRHSGSKHVHLIELSPWSFAQGVRATKAKLQIEELKDALSGGDRQVIASKAGIFLESLLRLIAETYETKLPLRSDQKWALGALTNSIDSKLSKLLKVEEWRQGASAAQSSADLKPLILAATRWSWVRNEVGCHFSIPGFEIPDRDVRLFAESTIELAERLLCSECGEFPSRNKSGSYRECRCGLRRMYPLAAPGASGTGIE